jgi:hypothetical protein
VPDPAPPAEGEYQEYAEDPNQYQEEQYAEWIIDGAGWGVIFKLSNINKLNSSYGCQKSIFGDTGTVA